MRDRTKRAMWIAPGALVMGGLFLIVTVSCSTVKDFLGKVSPWGLPASMVAGKNPDSHYLLGLSHQKKGRHMEAIREFEKALSIDPRYARAHNGLGVSYDLLEDFPKAIQCYETALKIDPGLDYVWNNLGYSHFRQGDADEAITAFKNAISLNSGESRFHNNLALAYGEKGEYDLAFSEFKQGGDEAAAYYNMAQTYLKRGLYHEAKSNYALALNLNPSLTVARTEMDAASLLSRIFVPVAAKNEMEELVVPDPPSGAIAERTVEKVAVVSTPEQGILSPLPFPKGQWDDKGSPEGPGDTAAEMVAMTYLLPPIQGASFLSDSHPDPSLGGEVNSNSSPFKGEVKGGMGVDHQEEDKGGEAKAKQQPVSIKEVGIEVSNGSGVNGLGKRIAGYLEGNGFKVVRLTNADHYNYPQTKIYYLTGCGEAREIARQIIGMLREMEELKKFDRPEVRVKILIGKDVASQQVFGGQKG